MAEAGQYIQAGLQSDQQLKDMLELQLEAVWPLEEPLLKRYLPQLQALQAGRKGLVLDVGCGKGAFARRLSKLLGAYHRSCNR